MKQRRPLMIVLLALPLVLAGAGSGAVPAAKPNVVVVMTDDQTVESLRVMANVRTLLAQEGTTFANSFASFALCCPSRATFITGQYGHNNTIMGNAPPQGGYQKLAPTHANTLPAWLRAAGYHTVHVGKYLNGYGRQNPTEMPAGWAEWYGSIDPTTYRFYNYTLNENGRLVTYGTGADNYQADVYTRKSVEIIRRRAPLGPFFLSVAYLAPHSGGPREPDDPQGLATPVPAPRHRNRFASEPLPAPPSFNEQDVSDKPAGIRNRRSLTRRDVNAITENYRQRLESLLAVDEGVAQIVGALRETGELANTLIIFTADNGFFHGEHRVRTGKVLVYEPSTRVPLIVRGPGVPRNRVLQQMAVNVDLAPTIVDAVNARAGRQADGRSLLPLFRDSRRWWARDVLHETTGYSAIRTPRWIYVEHAGGEQELYDLATDPHQLTSLHADARFAAVKAQLAARLARLRACAGAACRTGASVTLRLRYRMGPRRCARSAVRATVGGADVGRVGRVDFFVGGRAVGSDLRAPYVRTIASRHLRTRSTLMRALVFLGDGQRVTLDRLARRCARA